MGCFVAKNTTGWKVHREPPKTTLVPEPITVLDERSPMDQRQKKMMVVCSDYHDILESHLAWQGWNIIWAYDAKTAIAKARRERFNLTVLISTGQEMDVTETLLNLRDIRRSMPIVVVAEAGGNEDLAGQEFVPLSNTKVLPLTAIDSFVTSLRETSEPREMGSTRSMGS